VWLRGARARCKTRFRLLAKLCRVGLATHRVPMIAFRCVSYIPFLLSQALPPDARTTEFSIGADCKDFIPRKAVMPAPSAATGGSAVLRMFSTERPFLNQLFLRPHGLSDR